MKLFRALVLVLAVACLSFGQTTTISDTMYYLPNPTLSGTLTFNGTIRATPPVGRGSVVTSATGSGGVLNIVLAPTSYTVDYLLNGSSVCTERWNVPSSVGALTVYQVRGSTSKCAVREASEPGFLPPVGGGGSAGPTGPTGPAGSAATIVVGTTTTGGPGSSANVTNSGSSSAAVFNFTIPAGATGPTGPQGNAGSTPANPSLAIGTVSTLSPGASATAGVSGSYPSFSLNFGIPQGSAGSNGSNGIAGSPGAAATVSVGSTSTGAAGPNAGVTNSGSSSAAVLNFTIPAGVPGATGSTGPQGIQGAAGPTGPTGPAGAGSTISLAAPSSSPIWLNNVVPTSVQTGSSGSPQLCVNNTGAVWEKLGTPTSGITTIFSCLNTGLLGTTLSSGDSYLASFISGLASAAASGVVNVVIYGDSISRCWWNTTSSTGSCPSTGPVSKASLWSSQFANYLKSHFGDHGSGMIPVQSMITVIVGNVAA